MEANRSRVRWTYAEFARLPESGGTRYEVIGDQLVVTPAPGRRHQRILTRLLTHLHTFVEAHGLGEAYPGPFDVLFAEGDYLEPDLVFVRRDRLEVLSDRGVEGTPDLVVEILSPSTAHRDRGIKLDRYRKFGVPEYWIVDPDAPAVEIWRLDEGAEAPTVLRPGDALRWTPLSGNVPGEQTLEVGVGELLA